MLLHRYQQGPFSDGLPRTGFGGGFALGFAASVGSGLIGGLGAELFGSAARAGITLVTLAVAVIGVSAITTLPGALSSAALGWGVFSGFVIHQYGQLSLDRPDRLVLMLLMVLAVAASLLGLALRRWQRAGGWVEPWGEQGREQGGEHRHRRVKNASTGPYRASTARHAGTP
jgi:hypothetical protein